MADRKKTTSIFDYAITEIESLVESYDLGKVIRDGVKVVLAGSPNVGKSSLMNLLLQENRAIVSEHPGTTRDVIEETLLIDGIAFRLVDTAGLRSTTDVVEQEGVRRSNDQIGSADLILLLLDVSSPLGGSLTSVLEFLKDHGSKILLVLNKTDIRSPDFEEDAFKDFDFVTISCVTRRGIAALTKSLVDRVTGGFDTYSSNIKIQSDRHRQLLKMTQNNLISARTVFIDGLGNELVAIDLRGSLNCLGEIIGLTTPEDILNNIFSRFCIGK